MYNPTFIGDIDLNEETLTHYGVKGMKWRRRKSRHKPDTDRARKNYRNKQRHIEELDRWNPKTNDERYAKFISLLNSKTGLDGIDPEKEHVNRTRYNVLNYVDSETGNKEVSGNLSENELESVWKEANDYVRGYYKKKKR